MPDNPPTSLMAKRRDEMSYTVTWQPLTVLEAKGLIQYVIYYQKFSSLSKRQTSSPLSERVDGSENSTVVTGLEENVEYTFAIATVNSNNESSESKSNNDLIGFKGRREGLYYNTYALPLSDVGASKE